ncbi:MAG: 2-amino-4-hydroxy-6-hydroxymethyldihydropteridine diphosphokinase [Chitinophagaceae bacterium]|nr:2-amino-4-hydroxy-6-hydroxymethyldihydropteridine diphosphokinase [Chitinophagaceae bacterium]
MNKAYLLTGGNMGNRVENLERARTLVGARAGHVAAASSLYETSAWGNVPQPDYLNQVLLCETPLTAAGLLAVIMEIEQDMGRFRQEKYGPRVIDIDILFFNDEIIRTDALTIPHPRLHLRNFTLEPLNEIAPHLVHPVLGKTVASLLAESPDTLDVKKFSMENSRS